MYLYCKRICVNLWRMWYTVAIGSVGPTCVCRAQSFVLSFLRRVHRWGRKMTLLASPNLPARLFVCNYWTKLIFMKFYIEVLQKNLSARSSFGWNRKITGTLIKHLTSNVCIRVVGCEIFRSPSLHTTLVTLAAMFMWGIPRQSGK
jgi:hypothetical protein